MNTLKGIEEGDNEVITDERISFDEMGLEGGVKFDDSAVDDLGAGAPESQRITIVPSRRDLPKSPENMIRARRLAIALVLGIAAVGTGAALYDSAKESKATVEEDDSYGVIENGNDRNLPGGVDTEEDSEEEESLFLTE